MGKHTYARRHLAHVSQEDVLRRESLIDCDDSSLDYREDNLMFILYIYIHMSAFTIRGRWRYIIGACLRRKSFTL